MRISDWSSDVCSSDLQTQPADRSAAWRRSDRVPHAGRPKGSENANPRASPAQRRLRARLHRQRQPVECIGSAPCGWRSEEHTSELQSLMRSSYAVFCLKKKTITTTDRKHKRKQQQTEDNTKQTTDNYHQALYSPT